MLQGRIKCNTSTRVTSMLNCQPCSKYSEQERGTCGFSFWVVAMSNCEAFTMFWLPIGYCPDHLITAKPPTPSQSFITAAKTSRSY
jgi:hypothetical protein